MDGSTLGLPRSQELAYHFDASVNYQSHSTIMASVSIAYDVRNQLAIDIKPGDLINERYKDVKLEGGGVGLKN